MPPRSSRTPARRGEDERFVGVELERRQAGPDRHVEGAAGQVEHVPRDRQALQRRRRHSRALAGGEVIDPGDVAVRQEPAQLPLETIDEVERRLCGLRGVPLDPHGTA